MSLSSEDFAHASLCLEHSCPVLHRVRTEYSCGIVPSQLRYFKDTSCHQPPYTLALAERGSWKTHPKATFIWQAHSFYKGCLFGVAGKTDPDYWG